ncbi:large ribosomal subunit protein eL21-like isoform X2 [Acropora muricata]|uniref:large ribosomal subunit protein eL21-like isoform X2 n=1 Tax=Acropora muricata TaxID=159855 RepID=UPI0034E47F59
MVNTKGVRRGTRYMFARDFRKRGTIPLSTYMKVYKVGDYVDIKANGAIHKGMPYKAYHGRTGQVYNVAKRSLGVIVNKQVRGKILEKRINVRIEHVNHSKCRDDFLRRIKECALKKKEAKEKGLPRPKLKRQMELIPQTNSSATLSRTPPFSGNKVAAKRFQLSFDE